MLVPFVEGDLGVAACELAFLGDLFEHLFKGDVAGVAYEGLTALGADTRTDLAPLTDGVAQAAEVDWRVVVVEAYRAFELVEKTLGEL